MKNKIKIFENKEFGRIRTVVINDEPYFVGKDVAEILGYSNINKAVAIHVDDEDKKILDFKGFSHFGITLWNENDFSNKTVINESGVYSLIFGSKLPTAKKFKHWVTSEILPTIRKTGGYVSNEDIRAVRKMFSMKIILIIKRKVITGSTVFAKRTITIAFPEIFSGAGTLTVILLLISYP